MRTTSLSLLLAPGTARETSESFLLLAARSRPSRWVDLNERAARLAAPVLHEVAALDLADGAGRCFRRRRVIHQRLVVR